MKILHIEDDAFLQRAVKRTLERAFGEHTVVESVADAPTAIRYLQAALATFGCFHYDHIISDYNLTEGTGGDVLAWIKNTTDAMLNDWQTAFDGKSSRQVLLERFTFLTANRDALALHDRFIEKPIRPSTLARLLSTKGPLRITNEIG